MKKRSLVTLTAQEQQELRAMVAAGNAAARKLTRGRILLLADEADGGPAKSDLEIADALGCGRATVEQVRKQFVRPGPRRRSLFHSLNKFVGDLIQHWCTAVKKCDHHGRFQFRSVLE